MAVKGKAPPQKHEGENGHDRQLASVLRINRALFLARNDRLCPKYSTLALAQRVML